MNTLQIPGNESIVLKDLGIKLQDLGIETHINVGGEIGKPVFWQNADNTGRMILFLHPIDFYWAEYDDDSPEHAHNCVMDWIQSEIDRKAEEAIAKINRMYREKD